MYRVCVSSAAALALSAVVAGCGGSSKPPATAGDAHSSTAPASPAKAAPAPGATAKAAPAQAAPAKAATTAGVAPAGAVAVIRGWSMALAGGNVDAAARYFATPSVIQLDPAGPVARLTTQADVRAANIALPCGAKLLASRILDGYIDSLFLLGNRPGGDCGSGVGLTARVAFVIESGRITQWRRIPDEPGDSAHDGPGAQASPAQPPGQPGVLSI